MIFDFPWKASQDSGELSAYRALDDLCRNLDLEGMVKHKEQVIEHLQQHEDGNDSFLLVRSGRYPLGGLCAPHQNLEFALSSLKGRVNHL